MISIIYISVKTVTSAINLSLRVLFCWLTEHFSKCRGVYNNIGTCNPAKIWILIIQPIHVHNYCAYLFVQKKCVGGVLLFSSVTLTFCKTQDSNLPCWKEEFLTKHLSNIYAEGRQEGKFSRSHPHSLYLPV